MNVPGRAEGNWRWRSTEEMLSDSAFDRFLELAGGEKASIVIFGAARDDASKRLRQRFEID